MSDGGRPLDLVFERIGGSAPFHLATIAWRDADPLHNLLSVDDWLRLFGHETEPLLVDADDWVVLEWESTTYCFSTRPDPAVDGLAQQLHRTGRGDTRHGVSCMSVDDLATTIDLRRSCFAGLAVARCSRDLFQGVPLDAVDFIRSTLDNERIHTAATAFHVSPLEVGEQRTEGVEGRLPRLLDAERVAKLRSGFVLVSRVHGLSRGLRVVDRFGSPLGVVDGGELPDLRSEILRLLRSKPAIRGIPGIDRVLELRDRQQAQLRRHLRCIMEVVEVSGGTAAAVDDSTLVGIVPDEDSLRRVAGVATNDDSTKHVSGIGAARCGSYDGGQGHELREASLAQRITWLLAGTDLSGAALIVARELESDVRHHLLTVDDLPDRRRRLLLERLRRDRHGLRWLS